MTDSASQTNGTEKIECAECGDEVLEEGAWSLRDREGFFCPDCAHELRDVETDGGPDV